jgi:predicted RND superfamily exporter protein
MKAEYKGLDGFAVGFAEIVIRFRWLVIVATLALTGFMAIGLQYLAYSNNYRAFFSEDNPELQTFEAFQAKYTKSDNFLFVLVPRDGRSVFENETLEAVGRLTETGWTLPYVTRVDSLTNFQYTYADGDELIVEDLVGDPGASSPEDLARIEAAALAEPILNGQIVTVEGTATSINLVLTYPEESLSEVPTAVEAARALKAEIAAAYPHLDVYLGGTSMLNHAFSEAIFTDFRTLIPLMIGIIIITSIIAVRSVSATIASVLLVVLATIAAMGWAGFMHIELAGPSPSATIVILTLAVADSIHILMTVRTALRRGLEKREAILEAMRVNFLAVSITSVTTMVGFMALNFSDAPPFRDFGNISAVGILFAWLFSLTFLPAVLSLLPMRARVVTDAQKGRGAMTALADFVLARHRTLAIALGLASVGAAAFIPTLVLSDNFVHYFDDRMEFRRDTDALSPYFGVKPTEYSIAAGEPGGVADPEYLRTIDAFAEWLRDQDGVMHVYAITDIMKRLNRNMNGDDPAFDRLPDDRELAAQYLLLFELSLPYGLDLNDRIDIDKSASRVTATLSVETTTAELRQLLRDSDAWFAENAPQYTAPATGVQTMFAFITQRNVESMVTGTTIAIVVIAFIMMLSLRSVKMGLVSMVPNGLPILAAFGIWAIVVGEIGFSLAAVACLSLGIVIDDTVHFLTKYVRARRETGDTVEDSIRYAFETVGGALVANTVILMAGFAILTFSAFKINMELGLLTTLTVGLALILDLLFLPGLLIALSGRDRNKPTTTEGPSHAPQAILAR